MMEQAGLDPQWRSQQCFPRFRLTNPSIEGKEHPIQSKFPFILRPNWQWIHFLLYLFLCRDCSFREILCMLFPWEEKSRPNDTQKHPDPFLHSAVTTTANFWSSVCSVVSNTHVDPFGNIAKAATNRQHGPLSSLKGRKHFKRAKRSQACCEAPCMIL